MYTRGELFRWSYHCLLKIVSEFMEWDSLVYCRVKHGRNLFVQAYLMEFAIIHGTRKSSFLTFSPTTKWCWTHRFGDWVICDFKIQNILKMIEKGFYSVQKDVMSPKNIVDNDLICAEWWTFRRVCVCGEGFHLEISLRLPSNRRYQANLSPSGTGTARDCFPAVIMTGGLHQSTSPSNSYNFSPL